MIGVLERKAEQVRKILRRWQGGNRPHCAEQFDNDCSPVSTIVKGVKRAMAGVFRCEAKKEIWQGARLVTRLDSASSDENPS